MRPFWMMFVIGAVLGAALMFALVRTGKLGTTEGAEPDELVFDTVIEAAPGSPQQQRIEYAKRLEQSLRAENRDARVRADGLVLKVRTKSCNQAFVAKVVDKPADKQALVDLGFVRLSCSHGRKSKAWVDL